MATMAVRVNDLVMGAVEDAQVSVTISFASVNGLAILGVDVVIPMRAGQLKNPTQLNRDIMTAAAAAMVSRGHTEAITAEYLIGGFNSSI